MGKRRDLEVVLGITGVGQEHLEEVPGGQGETCHGIGLVDHPARELEVKVLILTSGEEDPPMQENKIIVKAQLVFFCVLCHPQFYKPGPEKLLFFFISFFCPGMLCRWKKTGPGVIFDCDLIFKRHVK